MMHVRSNRYHRRKPAQPETPRRLQCLKLYGPNGKFGSAKDVEDAVMRCEAKHQSVVLSAITPTTDAGRRTGSISEDAAIHAAQNPIATTDARNEALRELVDKASNEAIQGYVERPNGDRYVSGFQGGIQRFKECILALIDGEAP